MLSGLSRARLLAQAQPLAVHTSSRNTADCLQPGRGIRDDGGAGTGREPGGRDAVSSQLPGTASLFLKGSTRNVEEACPSHPAMLTPALLPSLTAALVTSNPPPLEGRS